MRRERFRASRVRAVLLAAFALLLCGFVLAGPASAHASLVGSSPADGSRLRAAPSTVTLVFDEGVGLGAVGYVHVTDERGARVDARAAYHAGGKRSRVSDDLRSGLGDGTYTVSYRVVSDDGHPVTGTIRFVVGNGPLLAPSGGGGSTVQRSASVAFDVTRWVGYAGLALLGGAWLVLTVWPAGLSDRRAPLLVAGGWVAAAAAGLAGLVLQGPYTAGRGLSQAFDASLINDTLHTNFGHMLAARLILLGLLGPLLGLAFEKGASRLQVLIWPLGAGLSVTYAAAGHAESTNPAWLSVLLDALHVLAMTVWLGGLVMLLLAVLPRRDGAELREVLPVFSRVSFVSVAVLAVTGTYAAWRGIGASEAIFGTRYGLLVNAKVLLFLGLIALGDLSRRLVRRFSGASAERLRRSVLVEVVLGVAVLAFTAVLVAQPRGQEALAAEYRQPVSASAPLGDGQSAIVSLDRGVHGNVSVTVELTSPSTSVTLTAQQKNAQIGPIPVRLVASGGTVYSASGVNLPVAGSWEFDLVVATSPTHDVTTDVTITLH